MLRRRNLFQERFDKFEAELRNTIVSGEIKPGEYILPENTLSQKYALSRVSVRKVLASLVEEGLIEKIPGKGNRIPLPSGQTARTSLHLVWFSTSFEIPIIEELIRSYEAANPFVRIELTLLPEVEYVSSVIQLIEKGTDIDLFVVSDSHFRDFIDFGRTDLLASYLPQHLNPQQDSYPELFTMFTYENELKVIPLFFSPLVVAYNKTMFEEEGIEPRSAIQSWDRFLDTAKRLTKQDLNHDGQMERYGYCFSTSSNRWPLFIMQNGGRFMDNNRTRSEFYDSRNIEALQYCVDFMYKHKVSPVYFHGDSSIVEHFFIKQRVAMIVTTYYYMNEFRHSDVEWDIMPIPQGAHQASLLIGSGIGLNRISPRLQLAQKFAGYMSSKEAQVLAKQKGCTLPMLRSVAEDGQWLNPDIHPSGYDTFKEVLPCSLPLRSLNLTRRDWDHIMRETNLLWGNLDRPEQVCRRVDDYLNETVRQRGRV